MNTSIIRNVLQLPYNNMKYKIFVWPVEICELWFQLNQDLLDDSVKLSEDEIDLIIKDWIMENIRNSKDENSQQLLSILQESFDMYAALEFSKRYKWELKDPSKEEIKEVYKDFMTHFLKLKPII